MQVVVCAAAARAAAAATGANGVHSAARRECPAANAAGDHCIWRVDHLGNDPTLEGEEAVLGEHSTWDGEGEGAGYSCDDLTLEGEAADHTDQSRALAGEGAGYSVHPGALEGEEAVHGEHPTLEGEGADLASPRRLHRFECIVFESMRGG